jgi:hypothetical protein
MLANGGGWWGILKSNVTLRVERERSTYTLLELGWERGEECAPRANIYTHRRRTGVGWGIRQRERRRELRQREPMTFVASELLAGAKRRVLEVYDTLGTERR